jgi:aminoglycoside phosphotransferase (APT) family kinase protein
LIKEVKDYMLKTPDQQERLKHVCAVASLEPVSTPQLLESYSNDTWRMEDLRAGSLVLRVSWRGDVSRLLREVLVAQHMPADIRYPEVLGKGLTELEGVPLAYSFTRLLPGEGMSKSWGRMDRAERRSAIAQLAGMMRGLHQWSPPAELVPRLLARDQLHDGVDGLLGADINPLPVARAMTLAEHAKGMRFVDASLMADAVELLQKYQHLDPPVDSPAQHGLIHGDVHLSNLWRPEPGGVALLDLEWARFAPPLLDIQRLCELSDDDAVRGAGPHPEILRWMENDYPEIFRTPDAAARMLLFSVAYTIRHVIVAPPKEPVEKLPLDHSLRRLRRMVDGQWPAPGALPDSLQYQGQ